MLAPASTISPSKSISKSKTQSGITAPARPNKRCASPQEKTAPKKLSSTFRLRDTRSQVPELTEDIIRYRTITALYDQTQHTDILMRRH